METPTTKGKKTKEKWEKLRQKWPRLVVAVRHCQWAVNGGEVLVMIEFLLYLSLCLHCRLHLLKLWFHHFQYQKYQGTCFSFIPVLRWRHRKNLNHTHKKKNWNSSQQRWILLVVVFCPLKAASANAKKNTHENILLPIKLNHNSLSFSSQSNIRPKP